MPVLVKYGAPETDPNAGAQAWRQQDQGDQLFLRGQQLQDQQQEASAQQRTASRAQMAETQLRQAQMAQQSDQFQQEQDLRTREQDLRERQSANADPNQLIEGENGEQYQGNAAQANAARNLRETGATGDDFSMGMRKILGLPEPTVGYEAPDGSTLQLTPNQAAIRQQADRAAQDKADAHSTLVDLQNQRLDLDRKRYLTSDAKEQAAIDGKIVENQKFMQQGLEKASGLEVSTARHAIDDYIKAKGGYVSINDPKLLQMQEDLKKAMEAEKSVIEQGRKAATQPAKQAQKPPGGDLSGGSGNATGTSTQGSPAPAAPASAGRKAITPLDHTQGMRAAEKTGMSVNLDGYFYHSDAPNTPYTYADGPNGPGFYKVTQ